jgi:hypothetical protein
MKPTNQAQPDMVYVEPPVNPPRTAMAASAGSGALGAAASTVATMPAILSLAWSVAMIGPAGPAATQGGQVADPGQNALGVTLLLGAIFLAGLALTLTAVAQRRYANPEFRAAVSLSPLTTFCLLNLAGLTVYTLGLVLLANGKPGFHVAALVGAVLEILAIVVGVRRHLAVARVMRGQAAGSATDRAAGTGY